MASFVYLSPSVILTGHYLTLGIAPGASKDDIRKAYLRASLRTHPDKPGGTKEAFQRVQEAFAILSDDAQRQAYDREVGAGGSVHEPRPSSASGQKRRRESDESTSPGWSCDESDEDGPDDNTIRFGTKHYGRSFDWVERHDPGFIKYVLGKGRVHNVNELMWPSRGRKYNKFYDYCKAKYGNGSSLNWSRCWYYDPCDPYEVTKPPTD
ncbi:unnamed protein product [Vitrella brassicaformis CCMP3155]|uniref:J domain-containing protein n=2 Tax=Vitrella brassicaformis TaxID=1169539 RepID=A0A0G4GBT3_VITBC|nr:unnamed protein product [Vitrella brassicaformis CCMP3155]|mmetsp:Transcript_2967/g.7519  ORF Transcript_2967/g.7519 Transcript_2967/m.7519 type:complete len:209 (+) Transcript_2967:96-722(+)|eukprot:CEM26600.1 unnamed protein product [Vitrella brassicaformis CCMP3155]